MKKSELLAIINENIFKKCGIALINLNGKYGYLRENGTWLVEPIFDYAYDFNSEDIAIIELNNKYGIIKSDGSYLFEPIFDYIQFYNGICVVGNNGKYGIISEKGYITDLIFSEILNFNNNSISLCKLNGKYGAIKLNGSYFLEPIYDQIVNLPYLSDMQVQLNGIWKQIDNNGNII